MVKTVDELEEIKKCIENNNNFLLSGGAGSGKTYSLVQTINLIKEKYRGKKEAEFSLFFISIPLNFSCRI